MVPNSRTPGFPNSGIPGIPESRRVRRTAGGSPAGHAVTGAREAAASVSPEYLRPGSYGTYSV